MKRAYIFLILLFTVYASYSQYKISGKIITEKGVSLAGANILIPENNKAVSSDDNGYFEFKNLKKGTYNIQVSHIGYKVKSTKINVSKDIFAEIILKKQSFVTNIIHVEALRAAENTPVSYTMLEKENIKEKNLGRDIPYMLSMTPSAVASSDAGAGIGYSSISIRGSGAKRINVTIDGVPINDPESHSVYWVNMPDLLSSIDNIQVQRGVGTSTNGVGAFGASINFRTENPSKEAYGSISSSIGSFNSYKNNISAGTGLLNSNFSIDTRISQVTTDGFVDRASSSLQSLYISGAYFGEKTSIRAKLISGKEKTYQAWWGVPKVKLENDENGMQKYLDHWLYDQDQYDNMIISDSRTYNYYTYDNETDNYQQDHFHLSLSHEFTKKFTTSITLHYTKGNGYYENYKKGKSFSGYLMNDIIVGNDTITNTDLIQQKWLENDFYGLTYALKYQNKKTKLTIGGAANKYIGDHFGKVIWAQFAGESNSNHEWYNNEGNKTDVNIFGRINYQLIKSLAVFSDLQFRHIDYSVDGIHDDLSDISMTSTYDFFNPKFGIWFSPSKEFSSFLSVAVANREPSRRNYIDADNGNFPLSEKLTDFEFGASYNKSKFILSSNLYFMNYNNQLVLTGEINNVGDAILTNVKDSYRAGIEIIGGYKIHEKLSLDMNITFSKNKIKNFTEYVDNWDTWSQDSTFLGETNLAFSPEIIFAGLISYSPIKNLTIDITGKYVGEQFIDNTSNKERMLDGYFINNLLINYKFNSKIFSDININFHINNVFNNEYESYAWVYRYNYESNQNTMDGYFPQAGRNYMVGINIGF